MKTIKRRTSSSLTPSRYETFLRSVQLVAMGLARSSSRLDRAEYVRLQREAEGGNLKFKTDYRLEEVGPQYFEVRGVFALLVEDPKTRKSALEIEVEYAAHLHAHPPIDRKLVEQFTRSDLRLILWPFFREYVFDVTGKMAIRPITVPISTSGTT